MAVSNEMLSLYPLALLYSTPPHPPPPKKKNHKITSLSSKAVNNIPVRLKHTLKYSSM